MGCRTRGKAQQGRRQGPPRQRPGACRRPGLLGSGARQAAAPRGRPPVAAWTARKQTKPWLNMCATSAWLMPLHMKWMLRGVRRRPRRR